MHIRKKLTAVLAVTLLTAGCSGAQKEITEGTTTALTTTTASVITTTTVTEPELSPVMEQYSEKSGTVSEFMKKIEKEMTLPSIHITTLDEERIMSKEVYVDSVIDIFNCDDEYRLTAEGGVRVRGNSTADGNEKPYRIKFSEKQNMLGLHEGMEYKNWVLLRSQWNLIQDFMGFSLAKTIFDGEYYSSDCTFVNVYINQSYKGIYLLCEQNQVAEGRVEVYEPKLQETGTDIGYFIEMDNYANEEEAPFFTLDFSNIEFTDYTGRTQALPCDDYSIKSKTVSKEQEDFIADYTRGVFRILYEAVENKKPMMFDGNYNVVSAEGVYATPKEAVAAVLDLDSVVNTMILQELVHNYDVGAGSFYMAVDFSGESKFRQLTFLAPWDFNWAYNDETAGRYYAGAFQEPVHDMYDRTNIWLTVIMKADWFREMLSEKWMEMGNGSELTDTIKAVLKTAETLDNDLGDENWKIGSAKDVVGFVRGRIKWLKGEWGTEEIN